MTPERLMELIEEHLSHANSKEAHLVLADRIYEESGEDLLAAGMRWHGDNSPHISYFYLHERQKEGRLLFDLRNLGRIWSEVEEHQREEQRLTEINKRGKVKSVKKK